MPAESNDDRLLFTVRTGSGDASARHADRPLSSASPLRHGLRVDAMPPRQSPQGLLTMLYSLDGQPLSSWCSGVELCSMVPPSQSLDKNATSNAETKHVVRVSRWPIVLTFGQAR
jgi:hypothetical protein